MTTKKTILKGGQAKSESFEVRGEDLLKKVKEIINEGNVRRISIIDKNGKTFIEFPLTLGGVGAVLLPALAAVGTIAALVTECTIKVERRG
jgi:hypothetical protein